MTGTPGFQPSTVRPNTIWVLGVSLICLRGSDFGSVMALGSLDTRNSNRPSNGLSELEAVKWTVTVCA